MGFTTAESEKALKKNKFSLNNAINYLLGRKEKGNEEVEEEKEEFIIDVDPKHMLFSNITGVDLKNNSILNYFRYILYSLDGILEY